MKARVVVIEMLLVIAGVGLSGCMGREVVPMTRWQAATADPALFDPMACPAWPEPVEGSEEVAVNYDFSAYQAYRCERTTRLKAGEQSRRIAEDVEKRNGGGK